MAIYQINEVKAQQQGDWSATAQRNYTRILQCLSNDPLDDSAAVLEAVCAYLGITPGIPIIVIYQCGNSIDPYAYLQKISVLQETSHKGEYRNWTARLEYNSNPIQTIDNPLLRPTIISGSFQIYQKPIEKDINGKPILNKANGKLEGIEIDDARPHVTMVRNEVSYDWSAFAANLVNFVNSTFWYGCQAGQAKCSGVSGQGPNFENGIMFYPVTYEFQFRLEGWQPSFQNKGRKDVNGTPCTDKNGNEMDEPAFLDNNGKQLAWPVDSTKVTYVNPITYFSTDFNTYGLP